ncbi:exonuclease domain-containing protein [Polyangium sorediatum]|uniref:3'-5' exonuclease n=1 Tax=Polyangium sorediatum TaxID=889274 RepID=A0ABT6NQP7_9BACT|nr:3'-5' exonuclease [Polyangium sorediatum]MDI1430644.1 3'-5' exonuclease [Polyangium sorediatum]
MKVADPCGCFPTGRHYPGIAHLLKVRAVGVASELDASAPWIDLPIAFLDVETTGRNAAQDRLVEVAVVIGLRGDVIARHSWLVNPGRPIPAESTAVHGIRDEDVAGKPAFAEVANEILATLAGAIPAAYNAVFDRGFMLAELERASVRPENPPPAMRREVDWIDPLTFARELYKHEGSRALGDMAALLGIELVNAHRATDDAEAALRVLYALAKDSRVPRAYGSFIQEQRRLLRIQDEARARWRKPS